jgi:hypothetical protein
MTVILSLLHIVITAITNNGKNNGYIYVYIQVVFKKLDAFMALSFTATRCTTGHEAHANLADDSAC